MKRECMGKDREKRILQNKKMTVERKRGIAEEKLIGGILNNEDFVRIRDRIQTRAKPYSK